MAATGFISLLLMALVSAVSAAVAEGSAVLGTVPFSEGAWAACGAVAASTSCGGAIAATLACSGASAGSLSMVLSGEVVASGSAWPSDGAIAGGSDDSFSCFRNWSMATLVAALLKE